METSLALVLMFASVGCSLDTDVSLSWAFANATSGVVPYKLDVDGATRNLTAEAVSAYLGPMQSRLDHLVNISLEIIWLRMNYATKGIENDADNLNASAPKTLFDNELHELGVTYRELPRLVKDSAAVVAGEIQDKAAPHMTTQLTPKLSPQEGFVRMPAMVVNELQQLRSWLHGYIDVGVDGVIQQVPALFQQYRQQVLFPAVRTVQQTASRLEEQYGDVMKNYSSPGEWSKYEESRRNLTAVQPDS